MKAWKAQQPKTRPTQFNRRAAGYKTFRQCTRKKTYKNEQSAHNKAQSITSQDGIKLYVYQCGNCNGYHLTKQEGAEGKRIELTLPRRIVKKST